MAAAASLGEVGGVSLRELYETDDLDYLTYVEAVVNLTVDTRAELARQAERK